jgi:lipoate-protein ligase A
MLPSMRWHFILSPPGDGAHNMALDEALMLRAARSRDAVLRVYGWSAPTLSLGRNQRARGCYDEAAARALGIGFVRRPTGGRALLHHHEVTYSATMPAGDASAARAAYDFINDVLLGGLASLGVNAGRASEPKAIPPGLRPCFDVPAEHEISVGGRKLVGSAQWRRDGALLQHGSILVRDDQPMIGRVLKDPPEAFPSAATLGDALGWEPSTEDVARPILEALEVATGVGVGELALDSELKRDTERLRRAYDDNSWTWRR